MPTQREIAELKAQLKRDFEAVAEWRRRRAPHDTRNETAATELDALASTVDAVPSEILAAYGELFGDVRDAETHLEMLRAIGFSQTYSSASEFVRGFISSRTGG
jgi:hypothetical protein